MMPCDWIGIVTIRSDTLRITSMTGMISRRPGARGPRSRPSRNTTPCSYCQTIRTAIANRMTITIAAITKAMIRGFMAALPSGTLTVGAGGRISTGPASA